MSYTLAYTGAEIDALLGKIDAIFVAEYGSTIYSEVTAAIAAGNKVIVANAGKVYVYAGTDDNSGYVFTQSGPNAAKPNATYVTLSTGNVWSTTTVDLATLQQFYASLMEDTASGSIASFPDGAENVPVKELTAEIEPIQDLHGQPFPYPDGGYKNKYSIPVGADNWSNNYATHSNSDGALVIVTNANASTPGVYANSNGVLRQYIINNRDRTDVTVSLDVKANAVKALYYGDETNLKSITLSTSYQRVSVTYSAGGSSSFVLFATGTPTESYTITVANMQIEDGSTATDYAPYSNICPISGYTGAEITRTGKQLFDKTATDPAKGYENDNALAASGAKIASVSDFITEYIPVKPNTQYTLQGIAGNLASICAYDSEKNYLSGANYGGASTKTITTPNNAAFVRFSCYKPNLGIIQLEEGATASPYEAFGTVYSVSWSDHGTAYKGTAEYKGNGEWEITPTWAGVDMGDLTYTYNYAGGHHRFTTILPDIVTGVAGTTPINAISSMYKAVSWNASWTNGDFSYSNGPSTTSVTIVNDSYSDAAAFKTAMAGQTIVYELASPTSFIISGPDPETLLGDNNIWSDTGDISVKYRANTALYIEKKLGGNVQTLSMSRIAPTLGRTIAADLGSLEEEHPELDELTEAPELEPYEEPEAEEPEELEEMTEEPEAEEEPAEEPEAPEEVR